MKTPIVQRWSNGRDRYRPAGETISARQYEVSEVAGDAIVRPFIETHHYSGSYPAARFRFALHRAGELVGVAVFSHPCRDDVLTNVFPGKPTDSVELGRFVLTDDVPANGETWFLARAFELLRDRVVGVLSLSDPMKRETADGQIAFGGHVGTIYQAHNAVYLGRGQRRTLHLLPDGSVFSARTMDKIRKRDRGYRYAAEILERFGAEPLAERVDPREWLYRFTNKRSPERITRTVRHPGNHRYAWMLEKKLRRHLPESLPYPKVLHAA